MPVIETTSKGHKIIRTTPSLFAQKLGSPCICDSCNNPIIGELVYIAVLNSGYCSDCFTDWEQRAEFYPEDRHIEDENADITLRMLNAAGSVPRRDPVVMSFKDSGEMMNYLKKTNPKWQE